MGGSSQSIRQPAVAGTFYPGDAESLAALVDRLLEQARSRMEPGRELKALASPHAGYPYSGPVAAEAYACLKGAPFSTVVLVGPDHYIGFEGVAVYPSGAFRTPLGDVEVDEDLARVLLDTSPVLKAAPEAHRLEHSLEVQIPFLQRVLPGVRIVPIMMGFRSRTNVEALANALSRALDNPKVLLVASTDLSHYHPREEAQRLDGRVQELVREFAPTALWEALREGKAEACGGDPLVAVMLGAALAGAESSRILRYADSGDATGDTRSVVGYLTAAFYRGSPPRNTVFENRAVALQPEEADTLLHLAFESAGRELHAPPPLLALRRITPALLQPGRAFVTLRRGKELRGCIGTVEGDRPLWDAVSWAARMAALQDPRFEPVRPEELEEMTVEVSVLTEPRPVDRPEEVEPGRHGVIVSRGYHRGLLLPQLAPELGWDRDELLAQTCLKAGLPADAWRKGARIEVFEAQVFEAEPGELARNGGP